jgi:hypothetical protein
VQFFASDPRSRRNGARPPGEARFRRHRRGACFARCSTANSIGGALVVWRAGTQAGVATPAAGAIPRQCPFLEARQRSARFEQGEMAPLIAGWPGKHRLANGHLGPQACDIFRGLPRVRRAQSHRPTRDSAKRESRASREVEPPDFAAGRATPREASAVRGQAAARPLPAAASIRALRTPVWKMYPGVRGPRRRDTRRATLHLRRRDRADAGD